MSIRIRPACADDLPAIGLLAHESMQLHYQHAPDVFAEPDIARDMPFWQDMLQVPQCHVLVALQDSEVVGFVFARLMPAGLSFLRPRVLCHVSAMAVAMQWRQQGIGKALLRAIEMWSKLNKAHELRLEVFDFNESAQQLYTRSGLRTQTHIMTKLLT